MNLTDENVFDAPKLKEYLYYTFNAILIKKLCIYIICGACYDRYKHKEYLICAWIFKMKEDCREECVDKITEDDKIKTWNSINYRMSSSL